MARKAKNVDPIQQREDVCRNNFVNEHSSKRYPEEFESLIVSLAVKMQRWATYALFDVGEKEDVLKISTLENRHGRQILLGK